MSKLVVRAFSVSIDGFGAGPNQDLEHPLGVRGPELFDWFFHTRTFQKLYGDGDGGDQTTVDDRLAAQSFDNIGAWIMGRNMFGPVRGEWPDESWRGWWGEEPSYHCPVFVLTHHARPSLSMKGGTVFHFVTDGIQSALRQAREAAKGQDVRVGGGATTIRQYLRESLIDELHLALSPVLMGSGEKLFAGLDLHALGYEVAEHIPGSRAISHLMVRRRTGNA
jgi:dihydrofolate reductase